MLKPRVFRNWEDYHVPLLRGFPGINMNPTLASTTLCRGLPPWFTTEGAIFKPIDPHVPTEVLKRKIRLVPGYSHNRRFRREYEKAPNFNQPRPLDCGFSGTTFYGWCWPVTVHRICCVNEMRKAERQNRNVNYGPRVVGWSQYMDANIRTAKLAPSPWGYGISCYREYESMLGGTIVTRPDSTLLSGWPDLFHPDNDLYIKCRMDFSDLLEIIDDVASNWDSEHYRSMRERAWTFLSDAHDPERTADLIADSLHHFGSML
jgi:hypothetical protein